MSATYRASIQPATFAGQDRAQRMPSSMHSMCMSAAPRVIIVETGVLASVSLFMLLHSVIALLLVSLVLISLTLSGLTGLRGLVGLIVRVETNAARGD
jgi:hypothetical protein